MKKTVLLLLTFLPLLATSQTQKKYFNFDGKEISYSKFNEIQSKGVLVGQNEEGTSYHLIKERESKGKINDYKELLNSLNSSLSINLSSEKPLFIHYSPGPDVANTTNRLVSNEDLEATKNDVELFNKKIQKEVNGQTLNVFKTPSQFVYEGNKYITWYKDPKGEIEKRFFADYHYWYASFVIIFPNGDYNAYYGEFSYNQVFDYIKQWKKNNKVK